MNETHTSQLGAKVAARNRCNELVKLHAPLLANILAPLMGKKVVKTSSNGFVDKVKNLLPADLPCNGSTHIWIRVDSCYQGYNIKISFRVTESYENKEFSKQGNETAESVIWIAETDASGVLIKFFPLSLDELKTDYKREEIAGIRAEYKRLQALADAEKSKLHYFGEYDRF